MQSSVENVRKILEEEHLDAFLVSTPSNISYLLTFFGFIGMEREAFVLVTKKSLYVFTSMIYLQAVKEKVKHATIIETTATKPFTEKLKTIAATEQIQRIGFEDTNLTVAELSRFSKVSVSFIPSSLHTIRKIK
ncbi:MAG: aminopeptidase P family N-terminal domain-containing protein, partial [Candidatus Levyibacteriota bacterium]